MKIVVLKSKIHMATLTGTKVDYPGSITIDSSLMKAADLFEFEKVLVSNSNNGSRLETYVIKGEKGVIELNGAAALLGKSGEKIIIMAFTQIDTEIADVWKPTVIFVDSNNKIIN